MKRKLITIILAFTLCACTIVSGVITNKTLDDLIEHKETIEEMKNVQQTLTNENEEFKNKINELSEILSETAEELESARQDIKRYTAMTYYNPYNVSEKSYATVSHMRRALEGTPLVDVSNAFVDAEEKYGVNAYFLAAIAAQESMWGKSDRAIYQNNLTGHAVYNSYAEGTYFSSWYESVMSTAILLKEDYLAPGGISYNGLSSRDVNKRYCFYEDGKTIDYGWSSSIDEIAYSLVEKANDF